MIDPSVVEAAAEQPLAAPLAVGRRARGYWAEVLHLLRRNRIGFACGIVQAILIVIALAAGPITHGLLHQDPNAQDLAHTFAPPGTGGHLLGSDELGRDTLSRLIVGAQVSLLVAYLTVLLQLVVGGVIGVVAGYYGGWIDTILMRFVDIVLSIPSIYLLILLGSLSPKIGPVTLSTASPVTLAIVIAVISWGGVSRLVRGEVLTVRERDFMLAVRSLGATDVRLMAHHLMPNVLAVVIVAASLSVGNIILTEAALDFIGLGIAPPNASWGNMLSNSQLYFYHSIWQIVLPGLAIFVTVLAMNIFGNALRDALDPRLRRFE
jgi:peptide/nickel transport system permease protein